MAKVKTFRINPQFGVPDKDIREFLTLCEQEAIISVETCYIPAFGEEINPRLTVIVTKLDDLPSVINQEIEREEDVVRR